MQMFIGFTHETLQSHQAKLIDIYAGLNMIHIKPISKYSLQILQEHSIGIHFFVLVFKASIVSEDFI